LCSAARTKRFTILLEVHVTATRTLEPEIQIAAISGRRVKPQGFEDSGRDREAI
jgi:hypothetical protein